MAVGAITVNEGTQSNILTDTAGTQEIGVVKIDLSAAGTYGSLWDGKLQGGTINVSTISSLPNIPGGTLTNLISGTINSATAVINSATISVLPNLPQGSIQITAGTITAGTITNLASGTINSATAVINSATISVLPNLPQGSINVTAETITSGSVRITVGTVGGGVASGAANSGNPMVTAGTDSGGTVYGFLTDTKGQQYLGGGTISMINAATISTLPNITGGSIVVTTGTIAAHAITAATITEGTLRNLISGTINSATAVINSASIS